MDTTSTIGRGTVVRGSVHGDGDLEIQGRVEGSVSVNGDLSIAETALIKSDVRGRRVTVRGAIAGNVAGTEAIVLEAGARVVGDLVAPSIGIRPGALLRGMVSTGAPGAETPAARSHATPARAAAPAARAPAARPAPPKPAVRPAPPPARAVETPRAPAREEEPSHVEHAAHAATAHAASAHTASAHAGGPPPPVVPQIKKGAKASLKRKNGR